MDSLTLILFLLATAVGSYVQSVAGFAMGMIIIAVVVGGGLLDVPVITAVVSLLSLVNIVLALRGHGHHLARPVFFWMALGLLPAVAVGVWLLEHLDARAQWLLELLLGAFIVTGSLSMMIRPRLRARISPPWACFVAGFSGGLLGGMFSASGPVMGWFNYRQPLTVAQIRTTLLASFALTTTFRTLVVGYAGGLTREVWLLCLIGLPVVLAGTWLGRGFPPPVAEITLKRLAFGLLVLMGCWSMARALLRP
ncbi:MAG: sulfite exporter TauE/SafE family protein [Gammaproteobacteria bacterium]|nr:sulfite exporter TauE/SafE family protein [Gammaproteobacteria bacterium]